MPEKAIYQDPIAAAVAIGVALMLWRIWRSASDEPSRAIVDLIAAIKANTGAVSDQLEQFKHNNALFDRVLGKLSNIEDDISAIRSEMTKELARQQGEREARR